MPYIYALRNKTTDLVYYGATKRELTVVLKERSSVHYHDVDFRKVTQCPTAYIELVEEVSEKDMRKRCNWWIKNNPCVNNL
jgi:hypothetical protein